MAITFKRQMDRKDGTRRQDRMWYHFKQGDRHGNMKMVTSKSGEIELEHRNRNHIIQGSRNSSIILPQ